MRKFRRTLFGVLVLTAMCLAIEGDSARMRSLSTKVLCDCGCRDLLGDCSHKSCQRKPAMRQEIAAGIAQGKTDQQILELVAAGHGSDIPVTPMFRGFNTLLWIVPVTVLVVAVGATIAVQVRGRA